MKRVLLIVIDALSARIILPAMERGRLPTLTRLAERGVLRKSCTSVFPSITPAATASIVTGRFPSEHEIAGNFWYDRDHESVAYYGDDFRVIFNAGFGKFFNDYLIRLNFQRLKSDTLYETVERSGLTAAAINFMWFRGDKDHEVNAPLLLELLPGVKAAERVRGPSVLALADFAQSLRPGSNQRLRATGGMSRRFGFHDDSTAEYLLDLAAAEPFPDFTLAYFPNNDFESHESGPDSAVPVVEQVDQTLSEFFDRMGGLDHFLSQSAVVIVGDHSQCEMDSDPELRGIDLTDLLKRFQIAKPGTSWSDDDELIVCPNMRAAQIYVRHANPTNCAAVIEQLLTEARVDQVIWRDDATDSHTGHGTSFHVATHDRGRLRFQKSSEAGAVGDHRGNRWSFSGELSAVDGAIDSAGQLSFGDYPNAFERIVGGFPEVTGEIWATAQPGHEFRVPETNVHRGGSHGSLHRLDSDSILIASGLADQSIVPQHSGITDVASICLEVLGIRHVPDA